MRLTESLAMRRALARRIRCEFITLWNQFLPRAAFTALGLLAFATLLGHAIIRITAVAFLIVWAEICDAQVYELFGAVHQGEYWYYARLLYLGAIVLAFDAFICIGQAMNTLSLYMEVRERTPRSKR